MNDVEGSEPVVEEKKKEIYSQIQLHYVDQTQNEVGLFQIWPLWTHKTGFLPRWTWYKLKDSATEIMTFSDKRSISS